MNPPEWLSALIPLTPCQREPLKPKCDVMVWHAILGFTHWNPAPGVLLPTRKETYGKTKIMGVGGHWTVAEIELVRLLRCAGWNAGWVDTFGAAPKTWDQWIIQPGSLPPAIGLFISDIEGRIGRTGGQPDIVAWRGNSLGETIFVEYKGPADAIRPTQVKWIRTAFEAGLSPDQLAVARWPKQKRQNGHQPNLTPPVHPISHGGRNSSF